MVNPAVGASEMPMLWFLWSKNELGGGVEAKTAEMEKQNGGNSKGLEVNVGRTI